MTASSPTSGATVSSPIGGGQATTVTTPTPTTTTSSSAITTNHSHARQAARNQQLHQALPNHSSAAFQQIKQTQASLARLYRIQQLNQQQNHQGQPNNNNQSSQQLSQQQQAKSSSIESSSGQQAQLQRPTTFVDCLIRRFKNCFSEDFCTVPMFVVGNLSPGSDGTHLILPPCVSLGSQDINRFSSPKNLRLMNSIRESCRSIEELDLGGNKLADLIEVYKILQCTPNLRFLNLSENDLSRTSPVALASLSASSNSNSNSASPISGSQQSGGNMTFSLATSSSSLAMLPAAGTNHGATQGLGGHSTNQFTTGNFNQRTCLAPINQNHQHLLFGRRRHHSTLSQPIAPPPAASASGPRGLASSTSLAPTTITTTTTATAITTSASSQSTRYSGSVNSPTATTTTTTGRVRPAAFRVAEARRLAAANALAQSRKTSSSVATKLANSAAAGGGVGGGSSRDLLVASNTPVGTSNHSIADTTTTTQLSLADKQTMISSRLASATPVHQRHKTTPTSTMFLARSLSSLSAKDARTAGCSPVNRFQVHRSGARKESGISHHHHHLNHHHLHHLHQRPDRRASMSVLKSQQQAASAGSPTLLDPEGDQNQALASSLNKLTTSSSHQKLGAVEPIVETDDVDMTEQQQSVATTAPSVPTATQQAPSAKSLAPSGGPTQTGGNSLVNNNNNRLLSASSNSSSNQTSGGGQGISSANITFRRTFESIKALALNNTGCQWRVVCSILSRMPNLEELHLSLNNYERIDLDPGEFKHTSLKRLYLCNNPKLTNWEELDKLLIAFPSLEALSIANCNISQIPDNLDRAREWRKLCGLNINGWPIKEWPVVERLNQLPSLIDLKCRNLEVLNTIDEPRHHLIARLPKLQRLNGSEIEEREHAEKAFLRFFMANSHLERPTRFHELIRIHGEVTPVDVDVDLSPPTHARVRVIYLNRNHYRKENEDDILMSEDFLIKLMDTPIESNNVVVQTSDAGAPVSDQSNNLQENMEVLEARCNNNNISTTTAATSASPSSSSSSSSSSSKPRSNTSRSNEKHTDDYNKTVRVFKDDGQEVVALDVDLRQSVRKFKSTIATIFGLEGGKLLLYYIDHEMVGLMGPEVIKHNQKKLWNYNVQDGDQFIVEER